MIRMIKDEMNRWRCKKRRRIEEEKENRIRLFFFSAARYAEKIHMMAVSYHTDPSSAASAKSRCARPQMRHLRDPNALTH